MLKINLEELNKEMEDMDIVIESFDVLGVNAKGNINFRLIGLNDGESDSWLVENKFKANKNGETVIDAEELSETVSW